MKGIMEGNNKTLQIIIVPMGKTYCENSEQPGEREVILLSSKQGMLSPSHTLLTLPSTLL